MFINTVIIVFGIVVGLFLAAFFIGSIMHCCGKDDYDVEDILRSYQVGNHSNNINIGGNCMVTSCDEYTMIRKDKYIIVITKDGISINGKDIDLNDKEPTT